MTRINVVPVAELNDKHLLAEYRELPRVFGAATKAWEKHGYGLWDRLPNEYTLGRGHVSFFYWRLTFCAMRQTALIQECLNRGFRIKWGFDSIIAMYQQTPDALHNDYLVTEDALRINRERIATRLREASQRRTARR